MKRCIIFFFYDKDGIVDNYVDYMLSGIRKFTDKLIVVCNGKLNTDDRKKFQRLSDDFFVRKNIGLDVWAYKEAIEFVGWDEIYKYDELILFNSTIMGPLYPFEEMFDTMEARDIDFWGITKYHYVKSTFIKHVTGRDYIDEHIQSHFIAIRKNMLKSREFKKHWDKMPMINTYEESIGYHESIFTKKFYDMGFKWDVYIDTDCFFNSHPILYNINEMIIKLRCPILKRRSFFHPFYDILFAHQAYNLLPTVKNYTDYNPLLIMENIIRTTDAHTLMKNLNYNFILNVNSKRKKPNNDALIIYIGLINLVDKYIEYIMNLSQKCDVYIISFEEFEFFNDIKIESLTILKNGMSIKLELLKLIDKLSEKYEYLSVINFNYNGWMRYDEEQAVLDINLECLIHSALFNVFEENNGLGLLMPPLPLEKRYIEKIRAMWNNNYKYIELIAHHLNLPIKKENVIPLSSSGMFVCKSEAIIGISFFIEMFSEIPDESIDFIITLYLQSKKYLTGYVQNERVSSFYQSTAKYLLLK